MSSTSKAQPQQIGLYTTPPSACSYLPNQQSRSRFIDPHVAMDIKLYGRLNHLGFRRSGHYFYQPWCDACQACQAVRVLVKAFVPSKNQQRVINKHQGTQLIIEPVTKGQAFYPLYAKYINQRHYQGDMYPATPKQYLEFLCSQIDGIDSYFFTFYRDQSLIAVTLVDQLPDGLSAIYTFFDPDQQQLSPGKLAILSLLNWAKKNHLPYVYLGYYVAQSHKMAYKKEYQPQQRFNGQTWVDG